MNKRGVAYVRVSSKKQDVSRQIEELNRHAESKGFTIVTYFEDVISSTKKDLHDRKGLEKLKKYLDKNKEIREVFVHEVSRLGRRSYQVLNLIEEFSQKDINIHIQDLNLSTLNENRLRNPESNIIISILTSMADNENRLLKDRIRSGLLENARKGFAFTGKITGYVKDEDGRPKIDKKEAEMVKRMYELAAQKNSLYFIGKIIQEEFNKEINSKTISGIIKNPFYKGKRKYLNETILVDRIVDDEIWQQANDFLASRKNFTKRYRVYENIVEGKIECYDCGITMYQHVNSTGRVNMFKCKKCGTRVNRPWLYEMIRYVVDKHTKKINDKNFKTDLHKKIDETNKILKDLKKEKEETLSAQLTNYEYFTKGKVKEFIYKKTNEKYEKKTQRISHNISECNIKKESYSIALKSKPKHFSDDLKTFKVQIQDIVSLVEVKNEFIQIFIQNITSYTIPQLHSSKIGWLNRKNKGAKMVFEDPFKTGIKVKNQISDEDLAFLTDEMIDEDYHKRVEQYLENEEE